MSERDVIARLAVEFWKLHSAFERVAPSLPADRLSKVAAQLRYSNGQLETLLQEAGLRFASFDGELYSAELPVSPLNAEDVDGAKSPYIGATIEPAVIADGTVIRAGKVILRGE